MRQQERRKGITLDEFADLCNEIRPGPKYELSFSSTAQFLERCYEVGLVTKQIGDDDIARYWPTRLLLYLLPDEDE